MKRSTSIILIAAAGLIVLGIALVSISAAFARNNGVRLRDELENTRFGFINLGSGWYYDDYEYYGVVRERTETFEDITDIDLESVSSNISIKRGGDAFKLMVEERYENEYDISSANGRLRVSPTRKYNNGIVNLGFLDWFQNRDNNYDITTAITLAIPDNAELESIDISSVNGTITTDSIIAEDFSANLVNGRIDVIVDAEQIRFAGVNAEAILTVPEGTADEYKIRFTSVNGFMRVNDETITGITLGEYVRGDGTRGTITMDTVNGSLTVKD